MANEEVRESIERNEPNVLVKTMLANLPISTIYCLDAGLYTVRFEWLDDLYLYGTSLLGERNARDDIFRAEARYNLDYVKSIAGMCRGLKFMQEIDCAFSSSREFMEEIFNLKNGKISFRFNVPLVEKKLLGLEGDILNIYGNRTFIPFFIKEFMGKDDYFEFSRRIEKHTTDYIKRLEEFRRRIRC